MMTPRQRYIETLRFGRPDRITFDPGHPRESTLAAWHKQGLPDGVNYYDYLLEILGIDMPSAPPAESFGLDFRMVPQFEEKVLSHRNGHYVVQDWKGNICEISDTFDVTYLRLAKDFVTRRWIRCPVETRDDWEKMKLRYEVDAPGRFAEDFAERCSRAADRDSVLNIQFSGPFWQMREWCGFEEICMLMIDQPDFVADMAAFYTDFVATLLERVFRHIVPDSIHISEDMAYKGKAMISPAMTREFCKPSWDRWAGQAKAAGVPLIDIDSDGFIGELIPIWIESDVNVCDPIEVAAHNDINEFRSAFGHHMAYRGGVDKRAMAAGGQVIRDEMKRIEPVIQDGGFIPGCDHGVPSDVSWPDYVDYSRMLAEVTGWI